MRARLSATFTASLFAAGLLASPALADNPDALPPQVLGLIAAAQPIPLTCADGTCTALVSSFCLQQDRPVPTAGQRYEAAGAGDVTLVVRRGDGSVSEFSAAGLLGYVSDGDFTRTRIELPQTRLASLGAVEVAVRIAPMVSLLPHTETPPAAAVAARDAETADGAPRFAAEAFFAPGSARADAAVSLTRLLNQLPAGTPGRAEPAAAITAAGAAAWAKVQAAGGFAGVTAQGLDRARSELDRCGAYADMGLKLTLRGCLAKSHDRTMRELNEDYWKSQPGY